MRMNRYVLSVLALTLSGNAAVADGRRDRWPDLIGAYPSTERGTVEVYGVSAASGYRDNLLAVKTQWNWSDGKWFVRLADLDGDGRMDIVGILINGDPKKGKIEVYGLSAKSGFTETILATRTPWDASDGEWDFQLVDVDGDGRPDLIGSYPSKARGTVELYGVSAASGYKDNVLAVRTPWCWSDGRWCVRLADVDGDGRMDIVGTLVNGDPKKGKIEVYGLSGKSGFKETIVAARTPWDASDGRWIFLWHDFDGDGRVDLVGILATPSRSTFGLYALSAASNFQHTLAHDITVWCVSDGEWEMNLAYAIVLPAALQANNSQAADIRTTALCSEQVVQLANRLLINGISDREFIQACKECGISVEGGAIAGSLRGGGFPGALVWGLAAAAGANKACFTCLKELTDRVGTKVGRGGGNPGHPLPGANERHPHNPPSGGGNVFVGNIKEKPR